MKNLDIYGEPVKILLNKNFFINTSIGGFFAITTLILVLVFTWFIGKDIVFKEKPISYMQTDIYKKFLDINITSYNFPFSFTMMDDDNIPLIDFSYLTIKLFELTYDLNPETGIYDLTKKNEHPVKFCNYSNFPLISQELFNDAQLAFTLCPFNNNFNLYGYWNEANLKYLQISIESCKNKTGSEIICKRPDEIKQYIADTGTNLNIFYVDSRVVINNNTDPVEYLSTMKYKYVIPEYYKKTTFKIQTQNILTDNGFIFGDTENIEFLKMVEEFTDIRIIDPFQNQFLAFEIYSSNISDTYFRRYIKVPDIIASLGGILKVFTMAFLYLNTIFSKVEKNISIVNEVFILNKKPEDSLVSGFQNYNLDKSSNSLRNSEKNALRNNYESNIGKLENFTNDIFKVDKKEWKKKATNLKSPMIISAKNENINSNSHLARSNILAINNNLKMMQRIGEKSPKKNNKDYQTNMKKYLELRRSETKIKFSFKDVMNIICNNYCKKKVPKSLSENFNFYEKAKNSVEHYFDFIFMIKKFEEINIVKNCLFTPEQSKMIEIMSKPIISSKEFMKSKKTLQSLVSIEGLNKDGECFLQKMKDNKIDRNIIKIIEENLQKSYI